MTDIVERLLEFSNKASEAAHDANDAKRDDLSLGHLQNAEFFRRCAAEIERLRKAELKPTETTGTVYGIEFVSPDLGDESRKAGTYVTIRIHDDAIRWSAGDVAIRYIPSAPQAEPTRSQTEGEG